MDGREQHVQALERKVCGALTGDRFSLSVCFSLSLGVST